jgi:hypothetical protein
MFNGIVQNIVWFNLDGFELVDNFIYDERCKCWRFFDMNSSEKPSKLYKKIKCFSHQEISEFCNIIIDKSNYIYEIEKPSIPFDIKYMLLNFDQNKIKYEIECRILTAHFILSFSEKHYKSSFPKEDYNNKIYIKNIDYTSIIK